MVVTLAVVLGFLVFIHEGGHFLAARAFGVRVTEFMIGLPGPSLGFRRGETRFGVTVVPLGGYAKVCGMAPVSNSPQLKRVLGYLYRKGSVTPEQVGHDLCLDEDEAVDLLEELADWGSAVRPTRKNPDCYCTPAYRPTRKDKKHAGVSDVHTYAQGDVRVVKDIHTLFMEERSKQYAYLPFWKRICILLAGPVMNLVWVFLAFILVYSVMGLDLQNTQTGEVFHYNWAPWDALAMGFNYLGMVLNAIIGLFNPATVSQTISNSASIIGIAVYSKDAFEAGMQNFIFFTAVVSASLGFMNMLPIPPLDGGRFVVEIFQKVTRKVVSMRALGYMTMIGVTLIFALFVVTVNQDINRFVFGNWG